MKLRDKPFHYVSHRQKEGPTYREWCVASIAASMAAQWYAGSVNQVIADRIADDSILIADTIIQKLGG